MISQSIFQIVLDALNRAQVRYVVVGGFAVNLRGYQRFTSDLDLQIDLSPRAAEIAIRELQILGFSSTVGVTPEQFADESLRAEWISTKGAKVISFINPGHPTFSVDIFIDPPVEFESIYQASSVLPIGSISVRTASIIDLIKMKKIAGRDRDLIDIANLEKIQKQKVK